jgi:CRP-like cAMP-binding protein
MSVDDFRAAVARSTNLHRAIQNYTLALISQLARTAACNSVHGVDLRLARWLLMSHDRAGRDRFPVTHEFAAMMLGVRRATVTKAAGAMHQAGLISYRHGQITILDRAALEAAACEDYRISRATYARLYAQPDPA